MTQGSPAECISWALMHLPAGDYVSHEICHTAFSLVLRLSGAGGVFYLKQLPPELFREAAVTAALAAYMPKAVPEVIAGNPALGCFLTADRGAQLRQHIKETGKTQLLEQAVQVYAAIQQSALVHLDELAALGLPDWRPMRLPQLFSALLADAHFKTLGFTPQQQQALVQYTIKMQVQCAQLAAAEIPASIEHADFQDKNVLVAGGNLAVIDWGEAVIAHPFFSLSRFLVSVSIHHKLDGISIRNTYLACWQNHAPPAALEQAYALVEALSPAYAALAYAQLAAASGSEGQGYWQRSILPLLKDILSKEPM